MIEKTLITIGFAIFGLLIGSFFGGAEYRIATKKKGGVLGRSICPHCNRVIKPIHLIPILGYVFQGGKCHHCGGRISEKYLIIETFTTLTFALLTWTTVKIPEFTIIPTRNIGLFIEVNTQLFLTLATAAVMLFLAYYDSFHKVILDRVAIPAIIVLGFTTQINSMITPKEAFIGAAIAFGFFLMQIVVSGGRWLGGGDLRIGIIMGLFLGWKLTILALFLSYSIGAIMCIPLLLKGEGKREVPFAPFLAGGTIAAMAWGNNVISWYMSLI